MSFRVALLGGECTGKTTLASALQTTLNSADKPVRWVPEALREWCQIHGRTPLPPEQQAIARWQAQRVVEASDCALLLVDTTPLMTAIYSDLLFHDDSLYRMALEHQRDYQLNLVLQADIPWVADPGQRDGPQARQRVHDRLLEVLHTAGLDYSLIQGFGPARTEQALQALARAWPTGRGWP